VQPKIVRKLHWKVWNFLFFATFVSIRRLSMYQVVYIHRIPIYQVAYTLEKRVFKKENQQKWLTNV
jgi:hypothetical protein